MKVIVMGCGRLGSRIATMLDQEGHHVSVLDNNESAFKRLPSTFRGDRVVGNAMDASTLRFPIALPIDDRPSYSGSSTCVPASSPSGIVRVPQ